MKEFLDKNLGLFLAAAGIVLMAVYARNAESIPTGLGYAMAIGAGVLIILGGWLKSPRRQKLKEKRTGKKK